MENNQFVSTLLELNQKWAFTQTTDLTSNNKFSSCAEADELCKNDSFAFLLACLVAQGMRADKIWIFPYKLKERLGNLTPRFIVDNKESVVNAIKQKPALHRFVNNIGQYVINCAQYILDNYDGHTHRIWTIDYDARNIQERLRRITGIGPKKAAMTVSLLHNFKEIRINNLENSNVAPDVHVIRVLSRNNIVSNKEPLHVMNEVKCLHPSNPSDLDYPLWTIGKKWCKSRNPLCNDCPINSICPKNGVTGISQ